VARFRSQTRQPKHGRARKAAKLARSCKTSRKGNIGPHCLACAALFVWQDLTAPVLVIRVNFVAVPIGFRRTLPSISTNPLMTRRSRARFRPSADGLIMFEKLAGDAADGIPRFLCQLARQCKVVIRPSTSMQVGVFLLIDKAIRKNRRFVAFGALANSARVVHFSPEEIHGNKICQLKIRNQEEPSGSMMARDDVTVLISTPGRPIHEMIKRESRSHPWPS